MSKRSSNCAICENSNRASICAVCVNYKLNECNTLFKSLKSRRDALYSRLTEVLVAKGKVDDQMNWRLRQNEKLVNLREKLRRSKEQLAQVKSKIEKRSYDLKAKYDVLESTYSMLDKNRAEQLQKLYPDLILAQSLGHVAILSELLHKQSVVIKQICKLFPQRRVTKDSEVRDGYSVQYDQICCARLPRGVDPHSVPSEELAISLGYMVQLLNLVVQNLAVPALHNSGFAGSCSRIWQRDSYWNARPSSRSNEYPLFIPRQNYCSTSGEVWDKSSSNFGVASMESEKRPSLDCSRNGSFNLSAAFPHSVETHKDLQKGISLLKKSVACITVYCYNSLCIDAPPEASTFGAFAKLLATLSSSKEIQSVSSLKMACSRKTLVITISQVWRQVFFFQLRCQILEKTKALLMDGILSSVLRFLLHHHRLRMLSIGLEPCLLMPKRNDLVPHQLSNILSHQACRRCTYQSRGQSEPFRINM